MAYGVMEKMFTREGVAREASSAKGRRAARSFAQKCGRCGGVGGWKGWPGYTCYDCNGVGSLGYECIRVYTAAELVKLNASREKRRSKVEAKRAAKQAEFEAAAEAKRAAFMAANGALVAKAKAVAESSPLITKLLEGLAKYGDWTVKQIALVEKVVAEVAENAAKAAASGWVSKVSGRIEMKVVVERSDTGLGILQWSRCWTPCGSPPCGTGLATRSWSESPALSWCRGDSFTLPRHWQKSTANSDERSRP